MTEEQKLKLAKLKKNKPGLRLELFSDNDLEALHAKFAAMQETVGNALDSKYTNLSEAQEKRFIEVNDRLVGLISEIERYSDNSDIVKGIKEAISGIKIPEAKEVKIPEPTKIPEWLAKDSSLVKLNDSFKGVQKTIENLAKTPSQEPGNFIPYRRVVKSGRRLVFDDNPTSVGGAGGNNNPHNAWSSKVLFNQKASVSVISSEGGAFGGYMISNENDAFIYLQVFDTTGAVNVGSTSPSMVFGIPPTASANVEFTNGIRISSGIKVACTTTATGSSAPSTGLDMTVLYE